MATTWQAIPIVIFWPLSCVTIYAKAAESVTCPSGWSASEESGTCIKLYIESLAWDEARAACQIQGGDLVKIVNSTMNDFVTGVIEASGEFDFWIGLHDRGTEDIFVWLDEDTEANFTNWGDDEPDNSSPIDPDGQDCVAIGLDWWTHDLNEWADLECNTTLSYICEIYPAGSSSGLSGGVVAGIAVLCLVIVLVPAVFIGWWIYQAKVGRRGAVDFLKPPFSRSDTFSRQNDEVTLANRGYDSEPSVNIHAVA